MNLFRDEEGQTLVFTALVACCLVGFMALAIDVGVALRQQRRLQIAADAAAIAAGWSYYYNGNKSTSSCGSTTGNIVCAADNAASANGVTNSSQVAAYINPLYGQHLGAEYIEVIIQQPTPTIFMSAFAQMFQGGTTTQSYSPLNVGARAVVGIVASLSCDQQLDPSNSGSLSLQGGASVNGPNCTMEVNSSSPSALCFTGNNSLNGFNVIGVDLVNEQSTNKNCNKIYPGASTGVTATPDPFANITGFFPTPSTVCPSGGANTITAATPTQAQIDAAVTAAAASQATTGGFQPTGAGTTPLSYNAICFNASVPTTLSGVTLGDAGINNLFIFENGLVISGGVTVNGTIDLNAGAFCQGNYNSSSGKCSFSGSNTLNVTAPANTPGGATSYAWNGLAFVMPTSNTTPACDSSYGGPTYNNTPPTIPDACVQIQFGSGSENLNGIVYTPGAGVYLQDNGGGTCPQAGTVVASLITADLYVKGSLCITNYSLAHVDSPLTHVSLVE